MGMMLVEGVDGIENASVEYRTWMTGTHEWNNFLHHWV